MNLIIIAAILACGIITGIISWYVLRYVTMRIITAKNAKWYHKESCPSLRPQCKKTSAKLTELQEVLDYDILALPADEQEAITKQGKRLVSDVNDLIAKADKHPFAPTMKVALRAQEHQDRICEVNTTISLHRQLREIIDQGIEDVKGRVEDVSARGLQWRSDRVE